MVVLPSKMLGTAVTAALMASLAIESTGCGTSSRIARGCEFGLLAVSPRTAHPGETVTVSTKSGGCRGSYPIVLTGPEVAMPARGVVYQQPIGVTSPRRVDGSFTVRAKLPPSLPPGLYDLSVLAPYPPCSDTASCAGGLFGTVNVTPFGVYTPTGPGR